MANYTRFLDSLESLILRKEEMLARIEYHKQKPLPTARLVGGIILGLFLIISSILLFLYPFASSKKVAYLKGDNPILFLGKQEGNALIDGRRFTSHLTS